MNDKTLSALYQSTRFQVLTTADISALVPHNADAYKYGWKHGIYPALHETIELHQAYEPAFRVSKDQILAVSNHLQSSFNAKQDLTFGDLENHFCQKDTNHKLQTMKRGNLISACGYVKLASTIENDFWIKLVDTYSQDVRNII